MTAPAAGATVTLGPVDSSERQGGSGPEGEPQAYFIALGQGRYRATDHAGGAWSAAEQHMGPLSGLLIHALETCEPRPDLFLSRVTFDILGSIPTGELTVDASVVRPGRTVQLVVAEAHAGGRVVVRATGWRLIRSDTLDLAGQDIPPLPPRHGARPFTASDIWPGGFIRSLEFRPVGPRRPGRGAMWLRSLVDLVAGEPASPLAGLFALVDTANGVAVRADPAQLLFPNVDLSVHLFRTPVGCWLGLDTEVSFGPDGVGLTAAVLHDETGPFGRAAQILTLRRR